ncbi:MAG: 2-oxo acid dehydrogenase subunit E2 [Candidatus Melainabacteria bacterium]|nr:2-oxo acid dehydrogenase subunit E2 [Candidatus Melainabacteria bacterium]
MSWLSCDRWNILDLVGVIGKGTVPTFLLCDVDMTWAEKLRSQLMAAGHRTTVTAIIVKAIAVAQRRHPDTRTAHLPFGRVVTFHDIVAGFTVERFVSSRPSVFLGTIKNPDTKSVEQIALELRDYAERDIGEIPQLHVEHRFSSMPWLIRRLIIYLGMLLPPIRLRYMGATFGVSSLGKFGIRALIPPCVCTSTFGVGAVEQRAVVKDGKVDVRPMMTLTLNFDHRLIDGAPAARFLDEVRNLLEGDLETCIAEDGAGETGGLVSADQ